MTFLPIVERELRVRSRLKSTYRFRVVAAGVAILISGGLLLFADGPMATVALGPGVFVLLAALAYVYCLVAGLRNTADCLSEEKRAGTLGLLFLTDLRGYDVVVGKMIATSLNGFYALLAIFPPLAIPLVLGGVTPGEFWRLVWLLVNAMFFSLTAGLFVSSATRDERNALGGTLLLVGTLVVVPPLLESITALPWFLRLPVSPTTALAGLYDGPYTTNPDRYWSAIWSVHSLSWVLLAAASFILPRAWHDRPTARARGWLRGRGPGRAIREGLGRRAARLRSLSRNPVIWLVARGEEQQFYLWVIALVAGGAVAGAWVLFQGATAASLVIFLAVLLLHLALALWVASESCHVFAGARDSGALEILLCTPLTVREILDGHILGLQRLFLRPLLALLAVEGVLLAAQIVVLLKRGNSGWECFFVALGVGVCVLVSVMDLYAVARYGMWMGLKSKKPGQAVTKTVLHVLLLPLLGALLCVVLLPLVGIVKNLIFSSIANENLRRYFRAVVTERYGLGEETALVGQPSPRARRTQLPPVLPR